VVSILYFEDLLYVVTKIPMIDNSVPEELRCTTCLLPMQYQSKKNGKFLWQCFKCGKQYLISDDAVDVEEHWSPPR
jgi:ribosomal protein L37AE/L43A